ncbi:MAG TPA: acylphosphatase [Candidatus Binatia bacterium]
MRGRVQGVWYRGSTRDQARRLGLRGWARNLADGSVEVVAEGDPDAIEQLVAWCRTGPPGARVTGITVQREPVRGDVQDFKVL